MTRPRGFTNWNPTRLHIKERVDKILCVFDEYKDFIPLTVRQICYRMAGNGWISKTKNEFDNVGETLVNMRRGQLIPMEWLRDDKAILGDTAWREMIFTRHCLKT